MRDIAAIVSELGLQAHPEGGYYRRIFASDGKTLLHGNERSLCTSIMYLLAGRQFSAFHRIKSDELWQLGEANTAIRIIELRDGEVVETLLSRAQPVYCIRPDIWFAAELVDQAEDNHALAYCTVAPGFDFADFELADAQGLMKAYPQHAKVIARLCIAG